MVVTYVLCGFVCVYCACELGLFRWEVACGMVVGLFSWLLFEFVLALFVDCWFVVWWVLLWCWDWFRGC